MLVALLSASACSFSNRFAVPDAPGPTPATWVGSIAFDTSQLDPALKPYRITLRFNRMDRDFWRYVYEGGEFEIARTLDGQASLPDYRVLNLPPGNYGAYGITVEWDPALGLPPAVVEIDRYYQGVHGDGALMHLSVRPAAVTHAGEIILQLDGDQDRVYASTYQAPHRYDDAAARRALGPAFSADTILTRVPF